MTISHDHLQKLSWISTTHYHFPPGSMTVYNINYTISYMLQYQPTPLNTSKLLPNPTTTITPCSYGHIYKVAYFQCTCSQLTTQQFLLHLYCHLHTYYAGLISIGMFEYPPAATKISTNLLDTFL